MEILRYMALPFIRAIDFSGRSNRSEIWAFILVNIICQVPAMMIDAALPGDIHIFSSAIYLLLFVPWIMLYIRRFHDLGRSGWNLLFLWALPFIIAIVGIVFAAFGAVSIFILAMICVILASLYPAYLMLICEGDYGSNDWGPPYGQDDVGPATPRESRNRSGRGENADPIANRRRLTGRQYNSKPYNS